MKKSLIALAVMAAAGAASAQSSVQLYGIADVWFGSTKTETPTSSVRQTVLEDGGVSNSRWGIKGSEDLGGGLKANFKMEQRVNLDSGAASGFNREAYVGLSGGFGEVQFGRMWTAYDDVVGAHNAVFDSDLAPANSIFYTSTVYNSNPNNGVKYISPNFGGFTFGASYAMGEDKTATLSASSVAAFNAQYANGPVSVAVAYQTEEPQGNGASTDFTRIGGSYDFGVAKLLASYGKAEDGTGEANEYQIGVDVPLASNIILSASYATSEEESAAGVKGDERQGFGAAVAYVLSKRTTVYAGLTQVSTDNSAGQEIAKTNIYAIGVKHAF